MEDMSKYIVINKNGDVEYLLQGRIQKIIQIGLITNR